VPAGGQHDLPSYGHPARSVLAPRADAIAGPVTYRHFRDASGCSAPHVLGLAFWRMGR